MPDQISALLGLIGIVIGAIPTYLFMRLKSLAEIEKLKAETDKTKAEAEKIRSDLKNSEVQKTGNEKSVIVLDDRSGFTIPLEVRCRNAQEICFVGISLRGIVSHHADFFLSKAKEGCKIRFLIVDPSSSAINSAPEFPQDASTKEIIASRIKDIGNVIEWLRPIINTGNAELRLTNIVPPYALTMIDPATNYGEIQVGLYTYKTASGASERPHFILTTSNNRKWHSFFKSQFEKMWIDAARNE